MRELRRLRLMNVGRVQIRTTTGIIEHRPTIVEVSARRLSSATVMYEVDPGDLLPGDHDHPLAPRMLGRIHHAGRTVILDPLRWGGDGVTWRMYLGTTIRSEPAVEVLIQPALGEWIWVDPSFAQPPASASVQELHNQKRIAMLSLTVHARLAQESLEPTARNIYRQNCLALESSLHEINRRLGRPQ